MPPTMPTLQPTVTHPTLPSSRPTRQPDPLARARQRTTQNTQFEGVTRPESVLQREHHKHAREQWHWFDGVPCDRCGHEIPPLEPKIASHGAYCSEECYLLAGGHIRGLAETRFGCEL